MSQLESALKRLAEGRFVCATRYPDEYDALSDAAGQRKAEEWLSMIGYRLARLSDEGAFFMAHSVVTTELRTRVRAEMKNVRGKLELMVKFLETIRRTQGRNPHVHAGDMLWGTEISEVARSSARLEHRVTSMHEISGARVGDSVPVRVERMLDQMVAEGYLVASHPRPRATPSRARSTTCTSSSTSLPRTPRTSPTRTWSTSSTCKLALISRPALTRPTPMRATSHPAVAHRGRPKRRTTLNDLADS